MDVHVTLLFLILKSMALAEESFYAGLPLSCLESWWVLVMSNGWWVVENHWL